jgi:hypothetical protein
MWVRMSEREKGQVTSHPIHSVFSLLSVHRKGREREMRWGWAEVDGEELVSCGRPHPFPFKNHQEAVGMGQMGAGDGDGGDGGGHPHQYNHYQALLAAMPNPNQTLHPLSIPFPAGQSLLSSCLLHSHSLCSCYWICCVNRTVIPYFLRHLLCMRI